MTRHVLRLCLLVMLMIGASPVLMRADAQDAVYPLPAPLYILTSDYAVLRIDPQSGAQTIITSPNQQVLDFAIAPDGEWIAYRSLDSGSVVIGEIDGMSGYVLDFDSYGPASGTAQTIAWNADSSALAYLLPNAVRIAEFGKGEYGAPVFSNYAGTWTSTYWLEPGALVVIDETGNTTQLSGGNGSWTSAPAAAQPLRPPGPAQATLTPEGVQLVDRGLVPNTAGALAFDWGPLPAPVLTPRTLPADLYYLAVDEAGIQQVWQLAQADAQPRVLTRESVSVTHYAVSPVGGRLAYITGRDLITADADGSNRLSVAQVDTQQAGAGLDWSPEGSQVAYHDSVGVWVVPGNGSSPSRQLVGHRFPQANDDPVSVQVFLNPRWSPDGAHLLVTIGLWEGSQQGIIEIATGQLAELNAYTSRAAWTQDKRVLSWSASMGYEMPGLFLSDPATPQARPTDLVTEGTPVADVFQQPDGSIVIVRPNTVQMGPQYVHLEIAPALGAAFTPMPNLIGGYLSQPQVMLGNDQRPVVAGFRAMTYNDRGAASGDLVILDLSTGELSRVPTHGPVSRVQWGP